jgi:hypothetical protein
MVVQFFCWTLTAFFSFLILYTVCRTPWKEDQSVARPLPTHRTAQTQNKRTQTSMPQVGFEPTIPVFERAKMVHALDRLVTVIGSPLHTSAYFPSIITTIIEDVMIWACSTHGRHHKSVQNFGQKT